MNYLILILVILFSLNVSSESFDEKIKKFLLNNPEIILESLENYEKKLIAKKEKINNQIIADNRKQILNTSNGMYSGNLESKNIIIEFFDYNCSYCKKAHQDILKIEQNKRNVKVIYKNFPILSENSKKLAEIALLIAKDNNEKFVKFHNLIMSRKGLVAKNQLKNILDDLGYDQGFYMDYDDRTKKHLREMNALVNHNIYLSQYGKKILYSNGFAAKFKTESKNNLYC